MISLASSTHHFLLSSCSRLSFSPILSNYLLTQNIHTVHPHNQYTSTADHNGSFPDFAQQFEENKINISTFQRVALGIGSAAMALARPTRADMVFTMAEVTGYQAMQYMRSQMLKSSEGTEILKKRPRINSKTVNLDWLYSLPDCTVGKTYSNFLETNKVTPDSRSPVQFIDDVDLAYVMQRYREIHDLIHTSLGMPTNMLGEVTVKWFEAIQFKIPMCIGGALFGPIRLRPKHRKLYKEQYLPWAIKTAYNAEFLLNIHFEKRWEQTMDDFHREFKIKPLVVIKK